MSSQQRGIRGERQRNALHCTLEEDAPCQMLHPTDSKAKGRGDKSELNRNGKRLPSPGSHGKRGNSVSSDFNSQEIKEYQKWHA